VPGAGDLINMASYDAMRAFRSPFVEVHELGFYAPLCWSIWPRSFSPSFMREEISLPQCSPAAKYFRDLRPTLLRMQVTSLAPLRVAS